MSNTVTRTLRIQSEERGAAQVAAALDKVAGSAAAADAAVSKYQADAAKGLGAASAPLVRSQEQFSKATLATAASIERLQKRVDPAYRSLREMEAAQRKVALAIDAGTVSAERGATIIAGYEARHQKAAAAASSMGAALVGVNDNAKLTANQMLNLSRQGNDVATMFALGAPPLQIFASQIGQIYGALQEGPGGLGGSLKAIGSGVLSVITPLRVAAVALTAVGAAAVYFGDRSAANTKKAEDAAKSYGATLSRLKIIQGDLSGAAGRIFDANMAQSESAVRAQLQIASMQQVGARRASIANIGSNEGIAPQTGLLNSIDRVGEMLTATGAVRKEYQDLYGELARGERTVESFQSAIIGIRMNPDTSEEMQAVADSLLDASQNAREAEARVKALQGAIREAKREAAQKRFDETSGAFSAFVPDRQTLREQINQAYGARQGAISSLQQSPRVVEGLQAAAERDRAKALAEVDRQETVLRRGRELDLMAVNARTVAEQALIASERERLALSGTNLEQSEQAARIAAQSALVIAQANRASEETLRSSRQQNAWAGLQGYQAAAQAIIDRYALEIEQAQGAADAVEKLTAARNLDLQTLQIQTQRSLSDPLNDRIASARMEASVLGQSDDARRKATVALQAENEIRRAGLDSMGGMANWYRDILPKISDYEDKVRRSGDAWDDVKRSGEDAIDGLVDSLTSGDFSGALKNMADDFAKTTLQLAVANPLKNALLGTSYGTMGDLFNGPGAAPSLGMPSVQSTAAMNVTAAVVNISGAGTGGAVQALNDNFSTGGGGVATTGMGGNSVQAQMANFLAGKGLAAHQVAGVLGNAKAESAFNPAAIGDGGDAMGLFQWNDRSAAMKKFVGADWKSDVQGQMEFFWHEMHTSEKSAFEKLMSSNDVRGANDAMIRFERPAGSQKGVTNAHNYSGRLAFSEDAYSELDKSGAKLADTASSFTQGFGQTTSAINAGIGQVANQFVPGFGGILTQLLDGMGQKTGGGGAGGLVGGLLGAGAGISASASSAIMGGAAGLFDRGGYTGPGGRHQARGIVHAGEVVFSQDDVARNGGVHAVEGMRLGLRGYAAGGYVPPAGVTMPSYTRMQSPANMASPQINQTFVNAPEVAEQRDESDGRGGRLQTIVFKKSVADATAPGTPAFRRLKRTSNVRQPTVT